MTQAFPSKHLNGKDLQAEGNGRKARGRLRGPGEPVSSLISTYYVTQEVIATQGGGADIARPSSFERKAEILHFNVGFPNF